MLKKIIVFIIILAFSLSSVYAAGNGAQPGDTWVSLESFGDDAQSVVDLHNSDTSYGIMGGNQNGVEASAPGQAEESQAGNTAPKSIPAPKAGPCKYDGEGDIATTLEGCLANSQLVKTDQADLKVAGGFKKVLIGWIQKIAGFLALGAIFAIAYGSLRLTLSMGEDDQIKKAKDIIKWGIIGFIGVISAGFLIALVVNVMYSIGG